MFRLPLDPRRRVGGRSKESWTLAELPAELQRFRAEAEQAGLKPYTGETYVGRSEQFIRWLAGDFQVPDWDVSLSWRGLVGHVGEPLLEAAQRFLGGLALGAFRR